MWCHFTEKYQWRCWPLVSFGVLWCQFIIFSLMMLFCLLTLNDPNKQQTDILFANPIMENKKEINILHSLIQLIRVMDGRALFQKTSFIIYTMGDKFWCILWCKSHLSCQSILIVPIYLPTSACLLEKGCHSFGQKSLFTL